MPNAGTMRPLQSQRRTQSRASWPIGNNQSTPEACVDARVKEQNEMTIDRTDDPDNPLVALACEVASMFGAGSRTPSGPAGGRRDDRGCNRAEQAHSIGLQDRRNSRHRGQAFRPGGDAALFAARHAPAGRQASPGQHRSRVAREPDAMTRLAISAKARSRSRVALRPSRRGMSRLRVMAITAATWPCGNERRISTASPDWLTTAPPFQEHAQTVDQRRRQLAEIGDGPPMDPPSR
jgi:hypothetical protein